MDKLNERRKNTFLFILAPIQSGSAQEISGKAAGNVNHITQEKEQKKMNNSIFVENLQILTAYQKKNDRAQTRPADLDTLKDARRRFSYQYNAGYYNRGKYEILILMLDTIEQEAAEVIKINKEVKELQKAIKKAQKTA